MPSEEQRKQPVPARARRWLLASQLGGLFIQFFAFQGLFHAPIEIRATAVGGSYVAMAVGWFFGKRVRERRGEAPFVFPLPIDRAPTWDERLAYMIRPRRMILVFVVLLFCALILNDTWICNSRTYYWHGIGFRW
jgi:hypothetical protein